MAKQRKELQIQAALKEDVTVIGIDEIAVHKGHVYETVLVDLVHGGVIEMNRDRSFDSVTQLLCHHAILSKASIQTIVVDMWEPFHKALRMIFPAATIVIDKYHVVQKVIQALDQVRKELQSSTKKASRYCYFFFFN
ncbi:transposase [Aneurinibacillus sp. Ricciae_BoGa-3]|uniref:transposase n=1 Tax=Aneurinibacillus sp. Ricciae_BoGa-3 TaxID=3022697 RepID=UPI002341B6BB|nr:transposase [Aneurinibacillus sp. Ricciae_BoGa-3]WCK53195.1 transposase [Aneurinibacillus sp. Ricciae_BoGa-3]